MLQRGVTTRDGKRVAYYRWGEEGEMHTYNPGNLVAAARAKHRAREDGEGENRETRQDR